MDGNARKGGDGAVSSETPDVDAEADAAADAEDTPPRGDIADEKTSPGSAAPAPAAEDMARLRAELEASRKRVDELARAYQSVSQDKEEFKARLTRERDRLIDVERGNVARTLIEAIDELDRCLASSDDGSPLSQGVRMIRDHTVRKLQEAGAERMQLVGQPFDPNVAEAADMEVTTNPDDDQLVVAEVAAGYRINDKVIRPAKVKVARYVAPVEA